jgi:hypothetical protein
MTMMMMIRAPLRPSRAKKTIPVVASPRIRPPIPAMGREDDDDCGDDEEEGNDEEEDGDLTIMTMMRMMRRVMVVMQRAVW